MNKGGKIVVFGAGATGRGHVGLLCWQAGYDIVFVDRDQDLVKELDEKGSYTVRLFGGELPPDEFDEVLVSGFKVYHSEDRESIANEIVDADLVLTAVFDQNLPDVAATLALALKICKQAGRNSPLNVISCENMMDSSSTLGEYVREQLTDVDQQYLDRLFGFPDCMISRVVPRPDVGSLQIVTENYNEWTVRKEAFKGFKLDGLDCIELVENQTARLERKLFIHNGGHAVCGYVGFLRGCGFIHQAVADPVVARAATGALDELGEVVRKKHAFSTKSIQAYKDSFIQRGSIAMLRDDVLRVVRDPIRKLSPRERLVAPALLAVEYDLPREWIVFGIVAALKYSHPNDEQSIILQQRLAEDGLTKTLQNTCGMPAGSVLLQEIVTAYDSWNLEQIS